ncbi:MAG: imidazole glycerol phosphate synthase subunit HisH [Acidobacteria bacterium]|nr:imidazole glycerol phosphate synthase subunit HisH [Acidobacteriota bacterium]
MITILDYGAGNLQSVQNTLAKAGAPYKVEDDAAALRRASKIILPGVGHFGQMMRSLDAMRVRQPLIDRIRAGAPFLGICLGLQALFSSSEEAPDVEGLGIFPGMVRRFTTADRVPHMGWNEVKTVKESPLLDGLGTRPYLYFAHSFYAPVTDDTVATCGYGDSFTAVLQQDNVFGVQFHPEKSGPLGLRIMRNFAHY